MQEIVTIEGRITIDNSPEMRGRLALALKAKPAELTVDLSRVTYIEMSGLATLVEASRIARQQGTRLVLAGIQGQIRNLLDITHLDQLFGAMRFAEVMWDCEHFCISNRRPLQQMCHGEQHETLRHPKQS